MRSDRVASCTALVEHEDGRFEIIVSAEPIKTAVPVVMAARAA